MPRRQVNRGFNLATVVQIGAIPLITGAIYFVGDWYKNGDALKRHDEAIAAIIKSSTKYRAAAAKEREKRSNEYFAYQQKTTEILSKMDTRLAVQETKQEVANQTLAKIADTLAGIKALTPQH